MNKCHLNTELSSLEGTRSEFKRSTAAIKLGIDVHQDFYVVVKQEGGTNPKPAQRFQKEAFLHWVAKLVKEGAEIHAVYEACGFGFGLQRQLTALGIHCYVVCPQKLDERNKRVKTDGVDAKALCLKLDRFVEGNRDALALVRVPTQAEEQKRAIHRQREQLVKARKRLEAPGTQFNSQPRDRAGKQMVEKAHLCRIASARLDERITSKHSTHPPCAGGKDPCLNRATARGRHLQATARTGALEQCRD
jgi:transposase